GGVIDGRDGPPRGSAGASGSGGHAGGGTGGMSSPAGGSGGNAPETGGTPVRGDDGGEPDAQTGGDAGAPVPDAGGTDDGGSTTGGGATAVVCTRTVPATNATDLGQAIGAAMAGDCIELADGSYTFPTIKAQGTADAPIVIRATNTLKATVSSGDVIFQGAAY